MKAAPNQAGDRSDGDLALQIAERIVQSSRRPVTVDGVDHVVTASIGVSYARFGQGTSGQPHNADSLLRAADAAMYVAKSRGKDGISVHGQPADGIVAP